MRKGRVFASGAGDGMNERAKCPRCGVEYDLLSKVAGEAIGGLCAACWCDWHERNIGEGRESGKSEENRRATSTES